MAETMETMEMHGVFEKLRALQDVLSRKIELEREIQGVPKLLVSQEEVLARMKKDFIEKNQDYEKTKEAAGKVRNDLHEAETAREKAEQNMEAASTQREYEILDKEIHDNSEREQQLRKDLQKEERRLADLGEQMKTTEELIAKQEQDLAARRVENEAAAAAKNARLAELAAEEAALIPGLDQEVLFKFDRILRHKMGQGIVAIKNGVCTGCHMILPAQFANNVRMGQEIVFCPYCSRILYYEDAEQGAEDFFDDGDSGSLADLEDLDDEDEEEEEERTADFEEQ